MDQSEPKPKWAVVATLKEPLDVLQTFIAHYKAIGADEIHVFLDDPEDTPSFECAASIEGVHPTLCDDTFWQGNRPRRHQRRQKSNAQTAYGATKCDWIIHLDADEFLYCPNGVANLLATQSAADDALCVVPAEPLIRPRTGEIKAYRSPLPKSPLGDRIGLKAFGDIYPLLSQGMISHSAGKFFLRTGLSGAPISIHKPNIPEKDRIPNLPVDDILLLHHHGCDEDEWVRKYHYRIDNTYAAKNWDNKRVAGTVDGMGLNAFLTKTYADQGEDGLRAFYRKVFHKDRNKSALRRAHAIHRPQLWLDQKRADLFEDQSPSCRDIKVNPQNGRLEARVDLLGFSMIIQPDFNYTEQVLASGAVPEEDELREISSIVKDKTVQFWDIGANTGLYSLMVASAARPDSHITAFEPLPVMISAISRNADLNAFQNICVEPFAVGAQEGTSDFFVATNLGQSSLVGSDAMKKITVSVKRLSGYFDSPAKVDLSFMKIDVEGAEPIALDRFFDDVPVDRYPDYILFEHQHTENWTKPVEEVFPYDVYKTKRVFQHNTLLAKSDRLAGA